MCFKRKKLKIKEDSDSQYEIIPIYHVARSGSIVVLLGISFKSDNPFDSDKEDST